MPLFRRRPPLHERLAREGGLLDAAPSLDPRPPLLETGIHGLQRPRTVDATVLADAPGLDGDEAVFVALPDGSLLVEEGPDGELAPLAAAVEEEVPPPYRARAVRRGESLWAVQATRIEVLRLEDVPAGDEVDVTHAGDERELRVDGERVFGSVRALEERGAREGREFVVHAERLDDDLWEVRASAL
ncbi:MAG TPA: hypothetical protein VJ986_02835 [Gaiellaceae bacterium]|nr:hypothetical protein [Gaiellaceae bacterium]